MKGPSHISSANLLSRLVSVEMALHHIAATVADHLPSTKDILRSASETLYDAGRTFEREIHSEYLKGKGPIAEALRMLGMVTEENIQKRLPQQYPTDLHFRTGSSPFHLALHQLLNTRPIDSAHDGYRWSHKSGEDLGGLIKGDFDLAASTAVLPTDLEDGIYPTKLGGYSSSNEVRHYTAVIKTRPGDGSLNEAVVVYEHHYNRYRTYVYVPLEKTWVLTDEPYLVDETLLAGYLKELVDKHLPVEINDNLEEVFNELYTKAQECNFPILVNPATSVFESHRTDLPSLEIKRFEIDGDVNLVAMTLDFGKGVRYSFHRQYRSEDAYFFGFDTPVQALRGYNWQGIPRRVRREIVDAFLTAMQVYAAESIDLLSESSICDNSKDLGHVE